LCAHFIFSLFDAYRRLTAASPLHNAHSAAALLQQLGYLLSNHVGGSSGALFGILLTRAGLALSKLSNNKTSLAPSPAAWVEALADGTEAVMLYGGGLQHNPHRCGFF
jgi:hypothetical protein